MTNRSTPEAAPAADPVAHDEYLRSIAIDEIGHALHYLECTEPLAGSDFSEDENFSWGRDVILRLLSAELHRLAWPKPRARQPADGVQHRVTLVEFGANKVGVIKVIREITGLDLKAAKDLVEGAPSTVKDGIPKADAEAIKKKLVEAGAAVAVDEVQS